MTRSVLAVMLFSTSIAIAQTATIRVDTSRVENHVSPRMYGAFVEMMAEDVKWGMTAEMVHDRSFEQAPDYLGLPADWRLEPDERNDNVGAIRFAPTTDEAYPRTDTATGVAEHALHVTLTPEDITDTRRGLSQGRLSVQAGKTYQGYVWIKVPEKNGYAGTMSAALEEDNTDGATYATSAWPVKQGDWQRYTFQLLPNKTDRFAKLTFLFSGKGTLYLDQVSLQPSDAIDEVRADSSAMIDRLHPSFLRWPGGNVAQDYHWQWGIGPRDLRPVWINKAWSNAPEPNDLGTDEYLALCSRLRIEPSITVNVNGNGATPAEAAAWVEYVNGPTTSKYGAMRAANGHSAPYGVEQWELGNETFGAWVRGHVDAETYAHSAVEYAHAMRTVDPKIRLIAVGEGTGKGDNWNSAVLRIAGSVINYLAIHDYTSQSQNAASANPRAQMMGRATEFEAGYRHIGELAQKLAPGRNVKLIVNEWNLFYPADVIQSMDGAVYAARMMNGFERDGDVVEANSISDLLNGWVGGVIQATRDRIYGTPQYYAIRIYNDHLGTERLASETTSPKLQNGLNSIDAIATRSSDGSRLFVKMSNAEKDRAISVAIDLAGFRYAPVVQASILNASQSSTNNTFTHSDAIKPLDRTLRCAGVCTVRLAAKSVAVLTFKRKP